MTEEEVATDPVRARKVSFSVRKAAHSGIYALLGIFVYLSTKEFENIKYAFITTMLIIVFLSGIDEVHQYFVPGRSMELRDVGIDNCGAVLGISVIMLILKLTKRGLSDR